MSDSFLKHELKIYNSLTKQKEVFEPIKAGVIDLYVCGITVYDHCHIGHARVFVAFDAIVRFLRMMGWKVNYVRNITDIDDKIIKRAFENKESIHDLTGRFIQEMDNDSEALGVLQPERQPRATEYITQMIALIGDLLDKEIAYVGDNDDVYFSVEKFPAYGELAHKSLDKLRLGARIEVEIAKRSPLDFVLWKKSKDNEPFWDAPWGPGRPGWHIECSAMAMDCLGKTIDIHGGGADLKFPHHENERAQAQASTNQPFVNTWMHVGFVQVDKEKMSKSLNNFFTIKEVLEHYEGEVIRYFLLASHYRSPVNYAHEPLVLAHNALTSLYTALRGVPLIPLSSDFKTLLHNKAINPKYTHAFIEAMSDDFNTPEALRVLFELAHELNIAKANQANQQGQSNEQALSHIQDLALSLKSLAGSIGLLMQDPELFLKGDMDDSFAREIETLIKERKIARETKDWARADDIRKLLEAKQIVLEDTPQGTSWRRA